MSTRVLLQVARRLAVVGLCALTGACYYLPPEVVPASPGAVPENIEGLTDLPLATATGQIRILFIHGMGEHDACDPDTLLVHLTKALHVTQDPPPTAIDVSTQCAEPFHFTLPQPTPVSGGSAEDKALLYRYSISNASRKVSFAFLLWSPLTAKPKETLNEPGLPHHAS